MGQAPQYAPTFESNGVAGQPDHQHNMMSQQQLQHQQHDTALQQQQHPEQHRSAPQHHHQQEMGHHQHGAEQKWHASYCGFCSPFDLCMKAWCCPCFVYGRTKHRMQSNGNMNGYDSMNSSVSSSFPLCPPPPRGLLLLAFPLTKLVADNTQNYVVFLVLWGTMLWSCLDPALDQSKRHASEAQPQGQWLHRLLVRVLLPAV